MYRPKLILLVGIPGSGKTTYGRSYTTEHTYTIHLSSDAIRAELYGDESIQGNPAEVFALMQKGAINALNDGYDVVYDATNIIRKDRANIITTCPKFAKIEAHVVWAPIETCIARDTARERTVSKEVIDRMLKRFQAPYYDEGIDEIKVILPDYFDNKGYTSNCLEAMKIPHDNPHHILNIHDHCYNASKYFDTEKIDEFELALAALLHDVGKPYVKSFIDSKGNSCEYAHYYQHQCVGAWMSYGITNVTPFIAWLISEHMNPFLNTKYYNNLPLFLKNKIDMLHEADLNSH